MVHCFLFLENYSFHNCVSGDQKKWPKPEFHTGTISGIVVDMEDNPIPNINVGLIDEDTGLSVGTTVTDENGRYEFEDIPPGNYTVVPMIPPVLELEADNTTVNLGESSVDTGLTTLSPTTSSKLWL